MRFLHSKLKGKRGSVVKVTFSKPTRVLIMTNREFRRYKENNTFTYFGGQKDSPYEFTLPRTDIWHVVVEKGTYHAPLSITASVELTQPVATPKRPKKALAHTLAEADEQMDQSADNDDSQNDEEVASDEDSKE